MSTISEVTLFVASNSTPSIDCVKYVQSAHLPVMVVRLDTPQSRMMAANGPHFQVTEVPTLIVLFQEGNLKMFVGAEKVLRCLQMFNKFSQQESEPEPRHRVVEHDDTNLPEEEEPAEEIEYEPPPPPKKVTKVKAKAPKKKVIEERPKTKKSKAKKAKALKAATEELEIDFLTAEEEEPVQRYPPMPKNGKTNKSVMEMAKEMEKQRERQLGYDENNLPRPSI